MIRELQTLWRFRLLIQSLVSRELKARYRGSVLGFLWSFINPLLLLLTYGLVFTYMLPGIRTRSVEPYFLFLFCGILPWTWFNASVLESSGVLIAGGNLIKKVLFPAEVLPVVNVLTNFVQFLLGLPILLAFLIYEGRLGPAALLLPIPLVIQLVFTVGIALLVSSLTVHFRDIQNLLNHLLHLWFFSSPILYAYSDVTGGLHTLLRFNPMTHLMSAYHATLFHDQAPAVKGLAATAVLGVVLFAIGTFVFERLRDTFAEEV